MKKLFIIIPLSLLCVLGYAQIGVDVLTPTIQTTVNSIANKFNTADTSQLLAKRDTQKLANGIRASIQPFTAANYKQVIADSCYTASFDLTGVGNKRTDQNFSFGKTITNPVVTRLTASATSPIALSQTTYFIYVSSLGTTSAVLHFANTNNTAVSLRINVQICPNGF